MSDLNLSESPGRIGVFDSGYGGLTILDAIRERLPQYSYLYLGDNARAPYGTRSFDVVYDFTRQAVEFLFRQGCHLVILACNTASAKALRTVQQHDLPIIAPNRRVLGVIRPTVEALGGDSTRHVGVLATPGTVLSHSYNLEIRKLYPEMKVTEMSCPMWVPLIENREADSPGADYFVKKYTDALMQGNPDIDTVILGCTHYPLLYEKIRECVPAHVRILLQGHIVGESLADYLERHPEIESKCMKEADCRYLTTEAPDKFNELASVFLHDKVNATRVTLQ